jgi:hypothetical protein
MMSSRRPIIASDRVHPRVPVGVWEHASLRSVRSAAMDRHPVHFGCAREAANDSPAQGSWASR